MSYKSRNHATTRRFIFALPALLLAVAMRGTSEPIDEPFGLNWHWAAIAGSYPEPFHRMPDQRILGDIDYAKIFDAPR